MIVKVVRIETDPEDGDHHETERVGWFKGIREFKLYMSETRGGEGNAPIPVHEIQSMIVVLG